MSLVSVEGIYKDGLIELAERPAGVETPTRVIVTFLPSVEDAPVEPPTAETPPRREGGQWRGKVWIADDFDILPDDIAEAFGMGPG